MDESAAVARARAGDHGAFGILVDRHAPAIANYLWRFLSDPDDIDDLLQEIFLKAYLNLARFDPARGTIRTWLFRIAANTGLDEIRRRQRDADRKAAVGAAWPLETDTLPAPEIESDTREHLRSALQSIPVPERQVVLLSFYHDLRFREIAQILDIPLGTVKSRMRSAMTRLRREVPLHEAGEIR